MLRFSFLDRPAIWGDESATLGRVCGDYQDLLDRLQYDGFGSLHYQLYWWIKQGFPLGFETKIEPTRPMEAMRRRPTPGDSPPPKEKRWLYPRYPIVKDGVFMSPFVMRFVPALAGTLMVPAMYWLAVQLSNRRVALITATLTTFSAYFLVYSRDAKMYMHLWFCMVLSVGCFLWWLRCARSNDPEAPNPNFIYRRIAWLGWVASAIAACGLHATGMVVLGIETLIFVTHLLFHLRQWKRIFTFLLGVAICASVPLVHYFKFSHFIDRVEEHGFGETGIWWVQMYNQQRGGLDLIKFTASAFATSWEWPRESQVAAVPVKTFRFFSLGCMVLLGALIIALLPWRWRRPSPQLSPGVSGEAENAPIRLIAVFWLCAWLVLPAYAMYCRSIKEFVSPTTWIMDASRWIGMQFAEHRTVSLCVLGALLGILLWSAFTHRRWKDFLFRIGALAAIGLLLFLGCLLVYVVMHRRYEAAMATTRQWESVWMPRYVGYLAPAMMILAAMLIARLPTVWVRGAVLAIFIGINLTNYSWRLIESEPPTDRIAQDIIASQPAQTNFRAYVQVRHGGGAPGSGGVPSVAWNYYMITYGGVRVSPLHLRGPTGAVESLITPRYNVNPQFIQNDLRRNPQIDHVVTWDKLLPDWVDVNKTDRLRSLLQNNWRRVDEQVYDVYDHWTWMPLFSARRREYVRYAMPATQPAARPATTTRN